MDQTTRISGSQTLLTRVTILLFIAIAGMLNLEFPFGGDQALFTIGAQSLARGGVLYRDFWDIKQPGIYWFYHAAGALLGYNEIGIHIAEIIWFTVLAVLISATMKARFRIAWMSDVCAVLTVGVYFAVCTTWHLTQLEGLVALPLFLSLVLILPIAGAVSTPRLLAFGMLAASVALFKLMLLAIPITFLVVSILPGKRFLRSGLIAAVGFAIVIFPVVIYFGAQHQLPLIYKTYFVYPPRIVAQLPMSGLRVLLRSLRWFLLSAGLLLPLAIIGAVIRLRKKPERFTVAIIAWILVSTLIVLIQRMWWEYHFLLVLFPLGILAAFGMEDVILWLQMRYQTYKTVGTVLVFVVVLCPYVYRLAHKAIDERKFADRQAFGAYTSPPYAEAITDSQWLNSKPPGEIYVLGDPLIYYLSDRQQTVPMNGWSPEWLLPEQWDELASEIEAASPRYVFVSEFSRDFLDSRGVVFKRVIAERFSPAHTDESGTWYERR